MSPIDAVGFSSMGNHIDGKAASRNHAVKKSENNIVDKNFDNNGNNFEIPDVMFSPFLECRRWQSSRMRGRENINKNPESIVL
jgi:hypothetical protein